MACMLSDESMLTSSMMAHFTYLHATRNVFSSLSVKPAFLLLRESLNAECTVVPPTATAALPVLAQITNALYGLESS